MELTFKNQEHFPEIKVFQKRNLFKKKAYKVPDRRPLRQTLRKPFTSKGAKVPQAKGGNSPDVHQCVTDRQNVVCPHGLNKEILTHATAWGGLENTKLRAGSQVQKDACRVTPRLSSIWTGQIRRDGQ